MANFGGWWKAIAATNGQLREEHEDKIRVIVRRLSAESRVRTGFAGGEDWIYSNYLNSALPAGRERFLRGDGPRRQEREAKRRAREEAQELRTARLKEGRRLKTKMPPGAVTITRPVLPAWGSMSVLCSFWIALVS